MADGKATDEKKEEEPNRIMVYLRIRPEKPGEIDPANGTHHLLTLLDDNKTATLESKSYEYDWIFNGPNVKQEDMFIKIALPVLENVFKGFWGTIMVYGQTGTGKSYTMCNFDARAEGIVPRTMRYIFERVDSDTDRVYTICFSFIQIYLDRLGDLFKPMSPELKIQRDASGVSFPGVVEHVVRDAAHFRELYDDGNQHRVITATRMNPESSRGHAALFIQLKSVPKDDPAGEVRSGKLFLIDLAGYERFSKTGVQEGLQAQEARTINASLLSLGSVVQALSERAEHVPWRNAKLTRMLEDAIGGRAKCSIILTAGPSSEHMHETLGTLYFGSRAMAVKTNAKLAVNIDYKKLAAKLQDMLSQANTKINSLEVEATKRQLEREESEARFQSEWARVKKRQEEQLQSLLTQGADRAKIEALIRSNQEENALLEEQHYQERAVMEERHEKEVKDSLKEQQEMMMNKTEESAAGMSRDIAEIQRQLQYERSEKEKYRLKANNAETEARRLLTELNELKIEFEAGGGGGGGGAGPSSPSGKANVLAVKQEVDRRVEAIRNMFSENMQLKVAEVEEPLREEVTKTKKAYDDLKSKYDRDLQEQKDALVSSYDAELESVRRTSIEVQEKLKKNHLTIKHSYQAQKERLSTENDELKAHIAVLNKQLEGAGVAPVALRLSVADESEENKKADGAAKGGSSGKKACDSPNRTAADWEQQVKDLKCEIEYMAAEKDGLAKQLNEYAPKEGEERLKPAAVRQLKVDNEEMKQKIISMEAELFKLRAAQALTGPQEVTKTDSDNEDDEKQEDIHGDIEGLGTFTSKIARTPYFAGTQAIQNNFEQIASSLLADLEEYRQVLRYHFFFLGEPNSGKSSVIKCLMTASVPLIRSAPEVLTPTVHPIVHSYIVDDLFVSRTDWHKLYVQFQDLPADAPQQSAGLFGSLAKMGSGIGLVSAPKGVADPAKIHLDFVDLPGESNFWRGVPSFLLPPKNVLYFILYNLTHPIDIVKIKVQEQLSYVHAACSRKFPKGVGGDGARVGICLIGTHRDGMRDSRDAAVQAHLNKITLSLGEAFFKLRGEDTFGLICVGNFAVSCRDWTVICTKGDRGPKTFKDLLSQLATTTTQLYNNKPTNFLPTLKDTASHMTYMLGDEIMENAVEKTAHLDAAEKRLRKGMVTFITGLHREHKVRWLMSDRELRKICSEHLGLDANTSHGAKAINFVIRELISRGALFSVPSCIWEPKYLPKAKCDLLPDEKPLPRDGIMVLDFKRMLLLYTLFICPTSIAHLPPTLPCLKDKALMMFDVAAQAKMDSSLWQRGIITQELSQIVHSKILSMTTGDYRLLFELFALCGWCLNLRSEVSFLAPCHFSNLLSPFLTDYIPYLLTNYGDGIGRRYKLNAAPAAFFSRLQLKLVPFSHAPIREEKFLRLNWQGASFLVLDKNRLKWGLFGSKALKDAVMQSSAYPSRGFLKLEGQTMFVVVTCRGKDQSASVEVAQKLLEAIHYEITGLCKREFYGVCPAFQELTLGGVQSKRQRVKEGVKVILERHEASKETIQQQLELMGDFNSPKGQEIEAMITAIPMELNDA